MTKNNMVKKASVAGITLIFIFSVFIPLVSSQISIFNTRKYFLPQVGEKNQIHVLPLPRDDVWAVTIEFDEPGGAYDTVTFGEKTDASNGVDIYDVPKSIPGFPPYIRCWFSTTFPDPYDELWEEYKSYPDTYKVWNLTIQWVPSDYVSPTTINISWNHILVANSEYNTVVLNSVGSGTNVANMSFENYYVFSCPALTLQRFKIICISNLPPVANDDAATVLEDSTNNQINVLANDTDPNGDTLTILSVTDPPHGTASTNGVYTYYSPDANYNGADSFIYTISDGHGGTDTATVNILVTAVNDPPNAVNDTVTVAEDSTNNPINALLNDNDIDGDTLTITSITQPTHGTATFTPTLISYTPTTNYNGPDSLTYTINDNHGGTDTATITITVTPVNDPPNANDDTATVIEDSTNNQINVRANDNDIDGDTLTIASVTQPTHGTSSNNGLYVYYTPTPNYIGPDSFTYTISDGQGGTDTAIVYITVTNINDPPVATDDNATVNEDTLSNIINVLSNDYDPDNNPLTIIGLTQPSHGISSTNGVFVFYTPLPNYHGSDAFTYTISDGTFTDSALVSIIVTPINDPPIVTNIPNQTIAEGLNFTPITLDNYVSDIDNTDQEITWTYTGNTQLSISIINRIATITVLNPEWSGSETILFRATDPGGQWDDDPATFTVTAVNDPPVVTDIPDQTIAEGTTFTPINLDNYVSDPDNTDQEITWTYTGNTQLSISIINRIATITSPSPDWYGTETITFRATDPGNLSDEDIATFTVTNVNDPPIVTDIPNQTVPEGASFATIALDNYVSDIDNTDPEITWTYTGNTQLSISIINRIATITVLNPYWFGSETITFRATDPGGLWDDDPATFTVTPVNDPPVFAVPSPANGSTGNQYNLLWSIAINDPEGNLFSWTIQCSNGQSASATSASNGTKSVTLTGLVSLTSYKVWVNATDPTGSGLYNRKWYTFMTKTNLPPVFGTPTPSNGSLYNNLSFTWSIPMSDPEGNLFSWSIHCSNGLTNSSTGATNGTKTLFVSGLAPLTTYKIWVNATDTTGSNLYTRRWYTFRTEANLPPFFGTPSPANSSINNRLSFAWRILIVDLDGNLFTWSIQCSNGHNSNGTGATNGTKTLFVSGLAPLTTYKIWVNATDPTGSNLYTRRWYTFTTGVNFPPVLGTPTPENGSTNNNLSFTWNIPINDPDGDLITWSIQCSNGHNSSGTGAANGTKTLPLSGLASLTTYTIWVNATDPPGINLYTRSWYTFTTGENYQPVLGTPTPENGSTNNNLSFTWNIPINDPDGDLITWSIQCSNGQTNSATGTSNGTKALFISGLVYLTTYIIWVNATDPTGTGRYTRAWYTFTTHEDTNSPPDKPERPSGVMSGRIKVLYNYSTSVIDVDGNQVWFWFDWGDGTNSGWVGPFNSSSIGSAEHSWTRKGAYNITVKAKDTSNTESVWSDPLIISMPLDVSELETQATTLHPVIIEVQETTVSVKTSESTETSPHPTSEATSPAPGPMDHQEGRNIREFIRLIIRMIRGEFSGMTLIQILRTEGWIR